MDSDFRTALDVVLRNEGGYVTDPVDPGGETYQGISVKYHPEWEGWDLVRQGFFAQAEPLVESFYLENYWVPCQCERLERSLAVVVFDSAVQHGVSSAVKLLQNAVNIGGAAPPLVVDGIVGEKTIRATREAQKRGVEVRTLLLCVRACEYLFAISRRHSQARFAAGWANRVYDLLARG